MLKFKKLTGCSVIVNTSFNVRGEPLVNSPEDAYKCFMFTDIILGYLFSKTFISVMLIHPLVDDNP